MARTLKIKRKNLGLTQAQFSNKTLIPLRSYKRYEADEKSNDHRLPDVVTAIRIADALGVQDLRELWTAKSIVAQPNG